MLAELDYRQEAANLRVLGRHLADFHAIVIPKPIDEFTTPRVLTMDFVCGTKVNRLTPLAALIVAAAVIMLVPTTFRLLGYPGLAMILFILAATGGAMLAL